MLVNNRSKSSTPQDKVKIAKVARRLYQNPFHTRDVNVGTKKNKEFINPEKVRETLVKALAAEKSDKNNIEEINIEDIKSIYSEAAISLSSAKEVFLKGTDAGKGKKEGEIFIRRITKVYKNH